MHRFFLKFFNGNFDGKKKKYLAENFSKKIKYFLRKKKKIYFQKMHRFFLKIFNGNFDGKKKKT
jgi:hypothetical protein